jgi:hypothetical protein
VIEVIYDRDIFNGKNQERWEIEQGKHLEHMPNQKWHQIVSFIKSGVRILGYVLIPYSLPIAAGVLIFSELIGIIEELV